MTNERIAELRPWSGSHYAIGPKLAECLDEIVRLDNIVTIQQKQIERLLQARDIEQVKVAQLTQALSHYANHPPPHPPQSLDAVATEVCQATVSALKP